MKRVSIVLVMAGVVLTAAAFYAWNQASDDKRVADSVCGFGAAGCDTSMDWTWPLILGAAAIAAFVAAWATGRSGVPERAEDLVG